MSELNTEQTTYKRKVERKVTIPAYLLPEELQAMHDRIAELRAQLRELERDFNGMLRGYFQ
jgi:inner membrane protein involved in colicin E2 resistance